MFVDCDEDGDTWRPRWVNQVELTNWNSLEVPGYANTLGAEGWELVNVIINNHELGVSKGFGAHYVGRIVGYRLVVKRPKS